jgi:hypothetical protein
MSLTINSPTFSWDCPFKIFFEKYEKENSYEGGLFRRSFLELFTSAQANDLAPIWYLQVRKVLEKNNQVPRRDVNSIRYKLRLTVLHKITRAFFTHKNWQITDDKHNWI